MKNQIVNYKLMQEFPGPLIREHTSKAQVIQFCQKNVKQCLSNSNINLIDPQSHALLYNNYISNFAFFYDFRITLYHNQSTLNYFPSQWIKISNKIKKYFNLFMINEYNEKYMKANI